MIGPEEVVRVTALRANDIGTLNGVTAEEDGLAVSELNPISNVIRLTYPVETDDIVVTLASVELDGETTRVTGSIWEFTTDCDSGESKEEGRLAANATEEVRLLYPLDLSFLHLSPTAYDLTFVKLDTSLVTCGHIVSILSNL